MSTALPPPSKKQKKALSEANTPAVAPGTAQKLPHITVLLALDSGEALGGTIRLPGEMLQKELQQLVNQLQNAADDPIPYEFALETDDAPQPLLSTLHAAVLAAGKTVESHVTVVCTPQAVFRVRPVTRSAASIAGHGATVLSARFAPHTLLRMVTGSGDSTAKIWDCDTQTPKTTLSGHLNWVLVAEYSPDGQYIATGLMDGSVFIWDAEKGLLLGQLTGHSKWVSSICWKPLHLVDGRGHMLVSGLKDCTAKIWSIGNMLCLQTLSGHSNSVSCVRWGGFGHVYTTLHDKTVMLWQEDGKHLKTLKSHAHWVNHVSLSTDYVIRKGCYTHDERENKKLLSLSLEEKSGLAKKLFEKEMKVLKTERMVTASDDFTMYLWEPQTQNKPLARMHGHQKLVNHVAFLPDGRHIVSASFDNLIKLWDGQQGKFLATFRGHVGPVYQVCWSSDNRLLVSASKDTTLKVWDVKTRKLSVDLPGHKDEVYAVDWSVDGRKVVSGGKDRMVRLWTH